MDGSKSNLLEFLDRLKSEYKGEKITPLLDKYNRSIVPDLNSIASPCVREGITTKIPEVVGDFDLIDVDGTIIKISAEGKAVKEGVFLSEPDKIEEGEFSFASDEIKKFFFDGTGFSTLLLSLVKGITFVRIPEGVDLKEPVGILHTRSAENPTLSHLTFIIAEEGSNSRIFEEYVPEKPEGGSIACGTFIFLSSGANIEYNGLVPSNLASTCIFVRKAVLMSNSNLKWNHAWFGGAYLRGETKTVIKGEGGQVDENHLFFSWRRNFYDFSSNIMHEEKNTFSRSDVRGVLNQSARSVFRTLAKIGKEAKDSESFVQDHVLLLSEKSRADSIPALEILNNSVKASHSASSGHIDKDKLFYLESRGMDEITARNVLVRGFFEKLVRFSPKEFKKRVVKEVDTLLEKE